MRRAYRRAAALMLAAFVSGGYAGSMAMKPWYIHSSGATLDPAMLATAGIIRSGAGHRPVMAHIAGASAPLALIAFALAIAGAGFVLRLSILPLLSVGSLWMSRASAAHSEFVLLSGRYTADFSFHQGGYYEAFLTAAWVTIGLVLALSAQLGYLSHLERRANPDEDAGSIMQIPALNRFNYR